MQNKTTHSSKLPKEGKDIINALLMNEDWAILSISKRITPLIKYKLFAFQDWEDVRQQCLMEIIEAVRRLPKIKNFWGLVRKITISSTIDYNRRYKYSSSKRIDSSRNPAPDDDWIDSLKNSRTSQDVICESKDLFLYVFQKLGKECRRLFKLIFIENHKYSEVASNLHISEGNLRVRIHRCKQKAIQIREEYFGK